VRPRADRHGEGAGYFAGDGGAMAAILRGGAGGPGDLVGIGISQPCMMLDKWRMMLMVNLDGRVIDGVHAFF
jgi:D-serine deaminase-like pyridoxal phosphate-dependent protein